MPAGEFYGEFGTFHGGPRRAGGPGRGRHGRAGVRRPGLGARQSRARTEPVEYQRDYYGAATPAGRRLRRAPSRAGSASAGTPSGCTTSRMSLNPTIGTRAGTSATSRCTCSTSRATRRRWGGGVAVERTQTALAWLDQLYGPFGWPQITNVHRIEGGGTEFPMMIHDGSADQGLIVHEAGSQLHHGPPGQQRVARRMARRGVHQLPDQLVLGDDGAATATRAPRPASAARPGRLVGAAQPRGEDVPRLHRVQHRDLHRGASCSSTSSARSWATTTMHRILQTFYERWKYQHVDEAAFRAVAEEVSQPGPVDLLRPVAAHHASCTTTRWAGCGRDARRRRAG